MCASADGVAGDRAEARSDAPDSSLEMRFLDRINYFGSDGELDAQDA
jgi:hypothetical protein